jgi:hypothetical protein
MDPLHPIAPGPPPLPSRSVPAVDRLVKISREGDRPRGDAEERRRRERYGPADAGEDPDDPGEGHVDIRV